MGKIATENTLKECVEVLKLMVKNNMSQVKTYEDIRNIVKSRFANDFFEVGDQIITNYTYGGKVYENPFDIVHIGNVINEAGNTVPGMILQQHYTTIEDMPFDAPEQLKATEETAENDMYYYGYATGSGYTLLSLFAGDAVPYDQYTAIYKNEIRDTTCNIINNGYNRWRDSAVRQWLNSDAEVNTWWKATHIGDLAPNKLTLYPGYMAGFDKDFLNILGKTQIVTQRNTITDDGGIDITYDTFFLPSVQQMHIKAQSSIENEEWEYYKRLQEEVFATNVDTPCLIKHALNAQSTPKPVRLRSAAIGSSTNSAIITVSGYINHYAGSGSGHWFAPACVIC